jgi:two-component system, OmpR family, response regulator VanR
MESFKNLKILYVEDEDFIRKNAVEYLGFYSDFVYEAVDGIDGYEKYLEIKPDIIICDIIMPKLDGLELIEKIRKSDKETKIIVATARLDTKFLLKAVELGLVKYITKPLEEKKLIDALNDAALLMNENDSNIIKLVNSISFDTFNKTVFQEETQINLTKKELMFLEICAKNKNRATSYEELANYVWEGYMTEDALRSVIKSLRKKLSKDVLVNISGIGYKLNII